jgi:predicted TIM-barrel fold metal-dependent hydrolase
MIVGVERERGFTIRSLDDWMRAFQQELDDVYAQGAVALKSTIAYLRSLRFEVVAYDAARSAFSACLRGWKSRGRKAEDDFPFPREAQDFMMHFMLQKANERHLVFQFHTGLQEGNGNIISNSDPSLMSNLFLAYPNVDFDLFHISYPYQGVAAALCKNFPNVFVDMCWAHIISPAASRSALADFLDALPYTKISAFGGDYMFVDGVWGHLSLARENVARVLAEKVREGVFTREKALQIGLALFHDNPARIFRLQGV